jgi:hypothetical protein
MLKRAALVAALGEVLFGSYPIVFQVLGVGLADINRIDLALSLFGGLALATFLLVVYRDAQLLRTSSRMRLTALIAAISLGIENLPKAYGTVLNAIRDSQDRIIWETHPARYIAHVLVPIIPAFAAISLIMFLIVLYESSLETLAQSTRHGAGRAHMRLRSTALLALAATVLGLGEFLYVLATNATVHTGWVVATSGLVRLTSLVSLALFFLFTLLAQDLDRLRTGVKT